MFPTKSASTSSRLTERRPCTFPADPEIGEPEIPAVDRTFPFAGEREFLLRETTGAGGWFAHLIHGLLAAAVAAWMASFAYVAHQVGRARPAPQRQYA